MRDAVVLRGPRLLEQRIVARHFRVPVGEVLPGGAGRVAEVGDPLAVGALIGGAGGVDEDDFAVLEAALLVSAEAGADDGVLEPAGAVALGDHPVPDVEVLVGGLDHGGGDGFLHADDAAGRPAALPAPPNRGDSGGDRAVGGLLVAELAGGIIGRDVGEAVADELAAGGHRDQVGRCLLGVGAAEDDIDHAGRAVEAGLGVAPQAVEGAMGALGFFNGADHDVGLLGEQLDEVPGLGRVERQRERLLALVVEQVAQGAFEARFVVHPRSDAAEAIAGGRLDPHHARAEIGKVAAGDDGGFVGEVEDQRAVERQ